MNVNKMMEPDSATNRCMISTLRKTIGHWVGLPKKDVARKCNVDRLTGIAPWEKDIQQGVRKGEDHDLAETTLGISQPNLWYIGKITPVETRPWESLVYWSHLRARITELTPWTVPPWGSLIEINPNKGISKTASCIYLEQRFWLIPPWVVKILSAPPSWLIPPVPNGNIQSIGVDILLQQPWAISLWLNNC